MGFIKRYFNSTWIPGSFLLLAAFLSLLIHAYISPHYFLSMVLLGIILLFLSGIFCVFIRNLIKKYWLKGFLNLLFFTVGLCVAGFCFIFFMFTTPSGPTKKFLSPSGKYKIQAEANANKWDKNNFAHIRLRLYDVNDKLMNTIQTGVYDVMFWDMAWLKSSDAVVFYEADTGTIIAYEVGPDSVLVEKSLNSEIEARGLELKNRHSNSEPKCTLSGC